MGFSQRIESIHCNLAAIAQGDFERAAKLRLSGQDDEIESVVYSIKMTAEKLSADRMFHSDSALLNCLPFPAVIVSKAGLIKAVNGAILEFLMILITGGTLDADEMNSEDAGALYFGIDGVFDKINQIGDGHVAVPGDGKYLRIVADGKVILGVNEVRMVREVLYLNGNGSEFVHFGDEDIAPSRKADILIPGMTGLGK